MTAGKQQFVRRASRGRRVLRRIELFLWVIGCLALGYSGHAYFSAGFYQLYESWRFDRMIQSGARPGSVGDARPGGPGPSGNHAPSPSDRPAPDAGSLIGRIEIPRLGLSAMVRHGDDAGTLTKAVGHLPRTSLPGQPGNVVLAGHRDTFYRKLRDIRKDDTITFTTLNGKFHYTVESMDVVDPDYTQALKSSPYPTLTLVTCYPFTYIGNAPRRFVVRAREVGTEPTLAAESSELVAADSTPVPQVASRRRRAQSRASIRQQPAPADVLSDQSSLSFTDLAFSFDSSSQAQKGSTPLRRLGSFLNRAGKKILFRDGRPSPPGS
jgi:sortase A